MTGKSKKNIQKFAENFSYGAERFFVNSSNKLRKPVFYCIANGNFTFFQKAVTNSKTNFTA